ncbi:NEW3 domain-containing protein [Cerasicoccus arenae]|uniref:Carbohydrate-binding domain-containing protein n=1 Tax=Cerasicoccus arenae TaxID=424488 RepID=A0A8J3GEP4_9BACT|nr:NEW3 domain-containing protein [Cerasicoccus arenae]MBK1858604.1 hypothetical protein [Cerasicoccus arenae]GHC05052.1 hypothetical protein GCM10007047_22480 [Cerasicoccus arenae]
MKIVPYSSHNSYSRWLGGLYLLVAALCFTPAHAQSRGGVRKVLEDFSGSVWQPSRYSAASGTITQVDDRATDVSTGASMDVRIQFSGQGSFEHFTVEPTKALYIPGDVQKISMRVKRFDNRIGLKVNFIDGWGRAKVDGKELDWSPNLNDNAEWQKVTFDVPKDWVRPIGISGISTHNYVFQSEKTEARYLLGRMEVETDISDVNPATGALRSWTPEPKPADAANALKEAPSIPLLQANLSTAKQANIFAGESVACTLQVINWNAGTLKGKASFRVIDQDGRVVQIWEEALSVESILARTYPVKADKYGIYHVETRIKWSDNSTTEKTLTLANVPLLPEPTEAQKLTSPYGLNYHGGGDRLFESFKKAGFYWYRDYAFQLDWMRRSKGADRSYRGWPNFPEILADYDRLGLICMPVLFAVRPPLMEEGKVVRMGPSRQWIMDIADIIVSFPKIRFWELANEYDLEHPDEERALGWENYNLYHKKFGELVSLLGDGQLTAVEQGRAGIYPVFIEDAVRGGYFDEIGVVNSHHYTGTDAPEINVDNYNSGEWLIEGRRTGSYFDALRMAKRAANVDGIKREHWLTEFGWDTLAGPVVTPAQQAAFLQRGFLLAFAADADKAFWFYNFDVDPVTASRIFDGCGLITHLHEPKLSFAAMAGLSSVLPRPVYIGSINVGPNTGGYVFENDGELVAGLWVIEGDEGPVVNFQAESLFDYLGNELDGLSARLGMFPVYATGFKKSDPLYAQTAYSIESNRMIVTSPGDTTEVDIRVTNNRKESFSGSVSIVFPQGWTKVLNTADYMVKPGESRDLKMNFTVPLNQVTGVLQARVECTEGGKLVKSMPLVIKVRNPYRMEVSALEGRPGRTTIEVGIENRSVQMQEGVISVKLPEAWQSHTGDLTVSALKPGERRVLEIDLTWTADWKNDESAMVIFQSPKGASLQAPIIPNRFPLKKARNLELDSDLGDWPAEAKLPDWMLGSTRISADAQLWLAWAPEGLYGAVAVTNSQAVSKYPRLFWDGDALELFISTLPSKKNSAFEKGDHQFWFVPNFEENRVYVGQWKVNDEIEKTIFDIPGIKSSARQTADGYIMEFLLPSSVFQYFSPSANAEFGVNANLLVKGFDAPREVYWPRKKDTTVSPQPLNWGRMKLTD